MIVAQQAFVEGCESPHAQRRRSDRALSLNTASLILIKAFQAAADQQRQPRSVPRSERISSELLQREHCGARTAPADSEVGPPR